MFVFLMETRIFFLLREEILKAVWLKSRFLLKAKGCKRRLDYSNTSF